MKRAPSSRDREVEARHERNFWLGQFYAGLTGFLGVSLIVLGYVSLTPSQPHRRTIAALAIIALGYALGFYLLRHCIVVSRYRLPIFAAASIVAFALLAPMCWLDGGVDSPITYLLIAAMSYLALGYPLLAVVICGLFGLASYATVVGLSARPASYFEMMMQLMALCDVWILALIGAAFRDRKDRELNHLRSELETRATIDSLTGCLNHRSFTQALDRETRRAARDEHALSLLLIDIDHFKSVNDSYGHMVGDEILRHVGAVLRETARQADRIGRPGGDELALLAPDTDEAGALVLADRVRGCVLTLNLPVNITLSIGICSMVPDCEQGAVLFRQADEALYRAKQNGRDQVAVFVELDDASTILDTAAIG